jgi:hypothetical protein
MNFEEIKSRWSWTAIRNCPGRFLWRENDKNISPEEILGNKIQLSEFQVDQVERAKDTVIVGRIIDGGLISYRKIDGTYLHTLNTVEGFERKLAQLGIEL